MSRAPAVTDTAVSLRNAWAEMEAGASLARQLVGTPFIPDSLVRWHKDDRGKVLDMDVDGTVAVVTAALLTGMELGFGPMASLRSIDVIHNTPALRAVALRALVQTQGHDLWIVESTMTRCVVRGRRNGSDVIQETTWTIDRARQLGVYPGKPEGQWRRQPQNMLVARASAEMARWIAADSILGIPVVAEELLDAEDEEAAAAIEAGTAAPHPEPPPAKRTAKRNMQTATRPALPAPPPPPPVQPHVPQQRPAPTAEDPEQETPVKGITKPQLSALNVALREIGVTTRPDAHALVSTRVNRPIASANDLTAKEASDVIDWLRETAAGMAAERERDAQDGEEFFGADDQ